MSRRDWRGEQDDPLDPGEQVSLAPGATDDTWTLVAAGDTAYRNRESADDPIGPALTSRFQRAAVTVANLEAPVTSDADPITKSGPSLDADTELPTVLESSGVDVATLANNHLMDYGADGLDATLAACDDVGLPTCGAGQNEDEAMAPARFEVDGTSVAVFSFCEKEFGIAEADEPGVAWVSDPGAIRRVATCDADVVVVAAHGGVEYAPLSPPHRQKLFREFAEAGADLVVGHHPHVAQGWELYDDTPIFYSLGNFLFPRQSGRPKTQWAYVVELEFDGATPVGFEVVPTEVQDETVEEMAELDGARNDPKDRLAYLQRLSEITSDTDQVQAHWQEIAVAVFRQRYATWLRRSLAGDLVSQLKNPSQHFEADYLWDADDRESQRLALLNLIRNESHNALMQTALEVETGKRDDLRTPRVKRETRRLLEETEDRPLYDRQSPVGEVLSALGDKMSS
ncbi:CapA family protein [Haloarchaeobius sp. DFWS5]|uniref:CapA family protein n=1 Tax=Haloarchaeobius sp. DFWS5 TaxID=3446114 RepID=UPI003EBB5787